MGYVILDNEKFEKKEKQDKLNLDLFRKVVNQSCKNIHLIYKLLEKGADPLFLDGEIIKQVFHQTGISENNLEFFSYCYDNNDDVKNYVHNKLNLGMALREPVRHIRALLYIVNKTPRKLTPNETEILDNPPINLVQGNIYSINILNQAIDKRNLFDKLIDEYQSKPVINKTKKMKLKI